MSLDLPDTIELDPDDLQCGDELIEYFLGKAHPTQSPASWMKWTWKWKYVRSWDTCGVGTPRLQVYCFGRKIDQGSFDKGQVGQMRVRRWGPLELISAADLKLGDISMGFWSRLDLNMDSWVPWSKGPQRVIGFLPGTRGVQLVLTQDHDHVRDYLMDTDSKSVVLARRAGPAAIVQPVSLTSSWNSKCARCGKGMYVGFVKTEHEGGACAG